MTETAIGFIETRGFLGVASGTDAMNKAADVDFVRQEHIGSGFVTTMVGGEVGAVRASVAAGEEAAQSVGNLLHAAVIARIHPQAFALCINWEYPSEPVPGSQALGLIETQGYVPMVTASDAAVKAAEVTLTNYFVIGSGFAIIAMRGDVGAVRAAVSTGAAAGEGVGKLIAAHVIPRPHRQLEPVFRLGGETETESEPKGAALGFMETHGLTALIAATDAAVKSASVMIVNHARIGSGTVSSVVKGDVAAVRAAVNAGRVAGEDIGKFLTSNVIPSPHQSVLTSNVHG